MKLFSFIVVGALAMSAVTADAWNGRRGAGPRQQWHGGGMPHRIGPQQHWGPQHRPPQFRPPHYQPPHYHPPRFQPPRYRPVYPPPVMPPVYPAPPPVLPPPIEYPVYPIPNPIPDPIEEMGVYQYFPQQIFVNQPCDPRDFAVPVVNTYPEQSIYCPGNYWDQCAQTVLPYPGMTVRPVQYPFNVRGPAICQVRPTYQANMFILLRNNQNWHVGPAENIGALYNQYRAMGICR